MLKRLIGLKHLGHSTIGFRAEIEVLVVPYNYTIQDSLGKFYLRKPIMDSKKQIFNRMTS